MGICLREEEPHPEGAIKAGFPEGAASGETQEEMGYVAMVSGLQEARGFFTSVAPAPHERAVGNRLATPNRSRSK